MGTVYAVAPEGCEPYLTPGRSYDAMEPECGNGFDIKDDDGDTLYCLWHDCGHANGDWGRVEIPERDINEPSSPGCANSGASGKQVGGDHYIKMKIQPLEFCMANDLDACQTKIIKYICRDKSSKLEDLEKARHVLDYYIDWVKNNV